MIIRLLYKVEVLEILDLRSEKKEYFLAREETT